jgi:hypothetical protein
MRSSSTGSGSSWDANDGRSCQAARIIHIPGGDLPEHAGCGTFCRRHALPRLGWWNGRHVRLRGVCRKACGFKSRPEHHLQGIVVGARANCLNPAAKSNQAELARKSLNPRELRIGIRIRGEVSTCLAKIDLSENGLIPFCLRGTPKIGQIGRTGRVSTVNPSANGRSLQ